MKSMIERCKVSFIVILSSALVFCFSVPIVAQSTFTRNDSYDFAGAHYLRLGGTDPDHFNIFIESTSDFRRFKLHAENRTRLSAYWAVNKMRIDMNSDGTWEQGWTASDIDISYYYPNPSGISGNYTITVEIEFGYLSGGTYNRTKSQQITIFSTPRVFVNAENDAFVQLRDEDATAKIPVLLIEGFDPTNDKFPELYYNLTWDLVNTDLYPNGYEVFILNFNDGGRDLRQNADVLLKALEKIHETCPNYKIVVGGLSMGGPITRYALAKKESQGGDHNVGLFLSYDSPQHWAHANPDMQDWIAGQDPNEGVIRTLQDNLKSTAAKQMLAYNTYDQSHALRNAFYNELNGLNGDGYPHICYNASVSNGNFNATWGYESVGRQLLTLKVNDQMIHSSNAVQMDCGTGSMMTDITMKRYGDIFYNPLVHIYYEMEIIFNPAYIPTWSGLDLVNYHIDDITGNIDVVGNSKFDDYVVQTTSLQHHELSTVTRNKISTWLNQNFNITVNYSSVDGGSINPDNYQVKILHGIPITVQPKTVTVNGQPITYNFLQWSDGNKSNPRTFYTSHNVSQTAIMKGQLASSTTAAIANTGQRKAVWVSQDNCTHYVYESMGKVWHERVNSSGVTVSIRSFNGKNPSITPVNGIYSGTQVSYGVVIVYQAPAWGNGAIRYATYNAWTQGYTEGYVIDGAGYYSDLSSANLNPVVTSTYPEVCVVWWLPADPGHYSGGLFYRRGQFTSSDFRTISDIYWSSTYSPSGGSRIATLSAINPALSQGYYSGQSIHLVYQYGTWSIQYKRLDPSGNGYIIGVAATVSSGDGNTSVRNPSIVAVTSSNTARISYVGVNGGYDKVTFKATDNLSSLWRFGMYTLSTNIGINNNDNGYIVAWTENGGYNKYTRSSTLGGTILQFNKSGSAMLGTNIQVVPGTSWSTMYGAALFPFTAPPYPIKVSDNVGALGKEGDVAETFKGRQGVVYNDDAQFYFTVGDVSVDGALIDFEEKPDTVQIDGLKTLNTYLITKPFTLNSKSEFLYDVEYGFVDSLQCLKTLGKKDNVNFKVQLVDNNNGKVIGEYDNVSFTPANVFQYNNIGYQVNTEGMQSKTVRLRLVVSTSLDAKYSLGQCFNTDPVTGLGKSGEERKQINFKGVSPVTEYALSQNYPNPFNPTTTISYALPKDGMVTIKIYDALGREVTTLVNEFKTMGRYNAEFDASSLASGMYVYRIVAVPTDGAKKDVFTAVKKMMLLK